ncbi:MAG: hypothetical protein FWC66_05105 [Oscillospiraceae bacterium]|nr:hypothetical protein [Oscillospiraceae bacterium]
MDIQKISRKLIGLGHSQAAANWLIAMHLGNGTLEVLTSAIDARRDLCEKCIPKDLQKEDALNG